MISVISSSDVHIQPSGNVCPFNHAVIQPPPMPHSSVTHRGDRKGPPLPGIIVNTGVIRRGTPLRLPSGCPFPHSPALPFPFVRSMPRHPPPGRPQGSALPGIIVNGDVIRRGTPLRLPSGRPLCRRAIPVCVIDVVASTTGATARVRPYENHDVYRRMSSR